MFVSLVYRRGHAAGEVYNSVFPGCDGAAGDAALDAVDGGWAEVLSLILNGFAEVEDEPVGWVGAESATVQLRKLGEKLAVLPVARESFGLRHKFFKVLP